jgi:protein-tyrosine phosphatase
MNQSYPRHINFEPTGYCQAQRGHPPEAGGLVGADADRNNHPLVFHCSLGKDRTGVLAAMLLAAAGVMDEDIIHDYTLSVPFMPEIRDRMRNDPAASPEVKELPDFQWEAAAESMARFLGLLRREYGSAARYLKAQGADNSLPQRLEEALLV